MSTLTLTKAQVGTSATDANNFTFVADEYSQSLKLKRGTISNEISQVLEIDNNHNLAISSNLTACGSVSVPTAVTGDNDTTIANGTFTKNQLDELVKYYGNVEAVTSVATSGAGNTAIVMDSAGNLYWAIANNYDGTSYNKTSYVYKVSAVDGTISTFASVNTSGATGTDLAFDSNGNLYWAICNNYNGTTYTQTSYVYKITPAGNMSTFTSISLTSAYRTSLAIDSTNTVYWAVTCYYNGSTFNLTSYVYKVTEIGTKSIFASVPTNGGNQTTLKFDTTGNLYWAVMNQYNGTTYLGLTSYVYKLTPGGALTTFTSQVTIGATGTDLAFDSNGNLYWAITSYYDGTSYTQTSYVYKITPAGAKTSFAEKVHSGSNRTSLVIDSANNVYWAVTCYFNGSSYNNNAVLYKLAQDGTSTILSKYPTSGGVGSALVLDTLENLYWAVTNFYNGATYNLTSYLNILYKE